MGFCMGCVKTGKNCCYSKWFQQRVDILLITIKYLEDKISKFKEIIIDETEDDLDNFDYIRINDYIETLQESLIKPIKKTNDTHVIFNILISYIRYTKSKESLIHFHVYGIYLLCKQSDCSGAYSIGESYDIVELLEIIKPYFDKSSDIYETVYTIKSEFSSPIIDIFRESITCKQPILIT